MRVERKLVNDRLMDRRLMGDGMHEWCGDYSMHEKTTVHRAMALGLRSVCI